MEDNDEQILYQSEMQQLTQILLGVVIIIWLLTGSSLSQWLKIHQLKDSNARFWWLILKKSCYYSFSVPSYFLEWKPFKNDGKCFLFHLKSSFRSLRGLTFCPNFFGNVGKWVDKKAKVNSKIYDFINWKTNN